MKSILAAALGLAVCASAQQDVVKGKVKETIEAGPYTYVLIATPSGDEWTAVPKATLKKGQQVSVTRDTVMEKFESPSLKRKFDRVIFGNLLEGAPKGDPHAGMSMGKSGGSAEGPSKPLPKAEGPDARTVAELYARKAELKGKTVAVRGKVVKYNGGIMGSNWVHLRDGSGADKTKDNDITVTSAEEAKVGDIVIARGTVALDKDLGAGYFYPVIIEKAALSPSK